MQKFLGFYPSAPFTVVLPYVAGYLAVGMMLIAWSIYDRLTGGTPRPELKDAEPEEEDE
jgi:hypothetical protein